MFRTRAYLTNMYLACFDLALTTSCYIAVEWWEFRSIGNPFGRGVLFTREHTLTLTLVLAVWVALCGYFGMYHSRRLDSPFADVIILFKVALASWIVFEGAARLLPSLTGGRFFFVRFSAVSFLVLAIARSILRLAIRQLRRRGHNVKQIVLVTSPELGNRLVGKIEKRAHYGYRILKHFVYVAGAKDDVGDLVADFREHIRSSHVDDVIIGLPAHVNGLAAQLVAECENQGVSVRIVPDLFPLIRTDTQIYDLDGIPLVNVRLYPTEYLAYVVLKRVFDLLVSSAVLVFLSPICLLIALLIKLTSPGPLFFSQERVGLSGRKFKMLKFRTMYQSSSLNPDSHWTIANDPHVTPLGRWLRRSNLDELPQFLNVLKGDMSIVGPRPERPFFLERFRQEIPEYMARHYVKSGITGWAQVNGWRGDTAIAERVEHDLYYIRNWGMKLDIKILFLTLMRTLFQDNAY